MPTVKIVEEGPIWWPSFEYLLGDLEVHYGSCSDPRSGQRDCLCDRVDPTIRLSAEAQLEAMYAVEDMFREWEDGGPDPACLWPEYT